ncbi:hydrolase, haloacid dehalogenase-like family [Bacillus cereus Q1]|uniref:Hydrolase, haloacid dehalogenase-like family n=1 Tax=Bacillus cereus (strain Q1) TaxID=361100 RepID=B9IXJ7_BACCQ|nr:hydrolase, haloacid dehalogenase-like family [Bacillus cereus Q1]TDT81220.1 putative hydrolase of the HAD superfamily [Bacillus sp. AG1163]
MTRNLPFANHHLRIESMKDKSLKEVLQNIKKDRIS